MEYDVDQLKNVYFSKLILFFFFINVCSTLRTYISHVTKGLGIQ